MLSKVSRATVSIMGVGALAALANINFLPVFADNPDPANINFQANVKEALSVSVTVPEDWVTGDINTLLRNKITLSVQSNNPNGFTASMTTSDEDTYLAHTTIEPTDDSLKINTLQSDWTRSDTSTSNFWGYSINDNDETGTYSPLAALGGSPNILISRTESIDADNPITSRDIYFGAKANTEKVAGTYSKTVVISVVSGIVAPDDPTNPVTPSDPVTPTSNPGASDPSANPSYSSTYNRTAYTTTTTNPGTGSGDASTTTTTNINEGDVVSSYQNPHGVKNTSGSDDNSSNNTILTTALATTAAVAAGAGTLFFVLAKRKKDDDK